MKRPLLLLLATMAAIALLSCATTARKREKLPPLYGTIFDQENKPVPSVELFLDGSYAATSDVHGRFSLLSVKKTDEHIVVARCAGFEPVELRFTYTDATQVMYISMFSADQLLSSAERSIRDKNWAEAEAFLVRAEKNGADPLYCEYLRAVFAVHRNDTEKAKETLLKLIDQGHAKPHVLLFLADIYEYHDNDVENAREYLRRFLQLRSDIEIEQRLRRLDEQGE